MSKIIVEYLGCYCNDCGTANELIIVNDDEYLTDEV